MAKVRSRRELPGLQGTSSGSPTKGTTSCGWKWDLRTEVSTAHHFQGRALPSRLKHATNRSALQAVFPILAADPPNNDLLTHSHLVLHNKNPNINTTGRRETSQFAGLTVGHRLSTSTQAETPVPFTKRLFLSRGCLGLRITVHRGWGPPFPVFRRSETGHPSHQRLRLSDAHGSALAQPQVISDRASSSKCRSSVDVTRFSGEHPMGAGQNSVNAHSPTGYTTHRSPGEMLLWAKRHLSFVNMSLLCKPV